MRVHRAKVTAVKRTRGKYTWVEKRVTLPPDFPEGNVVVMPEEDFERLAAKDDPPGKVCFDEDLFLELVNSIVEWEKARERLRDFLQGKEEKRKE